MLRLSYMDIDKLYSVAHIKGVIMVFSTKQANHANVCYEPMVNIASPTFKGPRSPHKFLRYVLISKSHLHKGQFTIHIVINNHD